MPSPQSRGIRLISAALALLFGLAPSIEALAQGDHRAAGHGRVSRRASLQTYARYAIEFRARYALSYGHVFVMYGPLDNKGHFATRTVAGLHPAGDDPTPWMIGHVLPVQAETGPSDGDLEDQYMSAHYRIEVNAAEYARIVEHIKNLQARSQTWHVLFNSCITFVSKIAAFMGLKTPADLVIYPQDFINAMKVMNEGNDRALAPSRQALGS